MITISTPSDIKPIPTMERVAKSVKKQMDNGILGDMKRASQRVFLEELDILAKSLNTQVIVKDSSWIFEAKSGEKISRPAGCFLMRDGILHQVVNGVCHDYNKTLGKERKVMIEIS